MKQKLLTEANETLEIMIDSHISVEYLNNKGFRRFSMTAMAIIASVHLFINFIGCYLISEYAYRSDFHDIAKILAFIIPGMNFLIVGVELIFMWSAFLEFKTSKNREEVSWRFFRFEREAGIPAKEWADVEDVYYSAGERFEVLFPTQECVAFIKDSKDEEGSKALDKLLEQFTGGRSTFRQFKWEVVKLAWKLGFRKPPQQ